MDAKSITYGETAVDKLLAWLRSNSEPQDIDAVLKQYLTILKELVTEEKE